MRSGKAPVVSMRERLLEGNLRREERGEAEGVSGVVPLIADKVGYPSSCDPHLCEA